MVLGSLAIGFLSRRYGALPDSTPLKAFWITGILGGFTTYSAFALESVQLIKGDQIGLATLYIMATLMSALVAAWIAQN